MAGSIQGDINQALGTLGALATFSPQLQEHAENMAEKRKIKKEEKALKEQGEAIASSNNSIRPEVEEDINKRTRELARRKFELNPSSETYSEYAKTLPTKIKEDPEILHEERMAGVQDEARRKAEYDNAYREAYNQELSRLDKMSQAMSRVGRQAEAKKTQKDSMRRYIEELPTDLGGKVKDLDPTLREQIISKYMEANDDKQE